MSEDKFGEPVGKDGSRVQRAIGVITEQMTALHPDDRKHALEALNKLGVLSPGISKFEKDQDKEREEAVKASTEWVEKVKHDLETNMGTAPKPEPKNESKKEARK